MIERSIQRPGSRSVSRRSFVAAAAATAIAPATLAQVGGLRLLKLNCCELAVSDSDATVAFYQRLFGMPVQSRADGRVSLRVGAGPQTMKIRRVAPGEMPAITHIGYSVADYEVGRVARSLGGMGYERIDAPGQPVRGIDHAMRYWIRRRDDTPEVFFADARGLVVQLTDAAYCGGGGPAGDRCDAVEAPPPAPLQLDDFNHFTVFVNDGAAANRYYQDAFGLSVQAYQGPQAPVTGIGDGFQFVMYAGPGQDGAVPATIHHGCFNMRGFDVDRVLATLTDLGLAARGDGTTGPLMHYVSLRMPERGGAEGGTPELYFTDPDGILMQLQDVSYCGGGGYLGDRCLPG